MPTTPPRIDDHRAAYLPHPYAISEARRGLTEWMAGWSAGADVVADLTLALSELVANAITASPDDASVLVSASCTGSDVVLEVANRADVTPEVVSAWDFGDELRGGGRGLQIVHAVVDHLGVDQRGGWTTVWCRHGVGTGAG